MLALLAALRAKVMGWKLDSRGSPLGIGQSRADFLDTVGVDAAAPCAEQNLVKFGESDC
jgi:hypothetical protein